eukprot:m.171711 g.171711  ORF g.171711 m.171711 type:complete len:1287 (-) comp21268_c0_seq2:260-4120(-)
MEPNGHDAGAAAASAASDEFDYNDAFPALSSSSGGPPKTWGPAVGAVRPTTVTEVFTIPAAEQNFRSLTEFTAGENKNTQKVREIQKTTNTTIDLSSSRDGDLTVVITGKRTHIDQARKLLLNSLQTQASIEVQVPREYHGFIIGQGGKRLKEIADRHACNIRIPRGEEESDMIKITGTTENCNAAARELLAITEERAKTDSVRLPILKAYHQLIAGYDNNTLKRIQDESAAYGTKPVRIHMPPHKEDKDEILVTGEKAGVAFAVAQLNAIYEEKKRTCGELTAKVEKSQHRYVIGPQGANLKLIMEKTGVVVEVPPADSDSETLILRGAQQDLVHALTYVYEKANSTVNVFAPIKAWLHKHVMGKGGVNKKNMMTEYPNVFIRFVEEKNGVEIEGPPEDVELVRLSLTSMAEELEKSLEHAEVKVDPQYHKRLVGKGGAQVDKIKAETGAQITIPSPDTHSDIISIEGTPEQVKAAKAMVQEIAAQFANFTTTDMIIDRRFHSLLIGQKGATISEIQSKFPSVNIKMPSASSESEIVQLRGDRKEVDAAEIHIKKLLRKFEEEKYQIEVPIFRKYHGNIIGRQGANIKKIMEETNTQITIPKGETETDNIVVVGRKEDCEKARDRLMSIQSELANIETAEVNIEAKYQASIIGPKGSVVNGIMQEFGVMIHFPQGADRTTKPNTVVIRGAKDAVPKAKAKLEKLAKEAEAKSHKELVEVKSEYHRFIIGRGGAFIKKLEKDSGCRLVFPSTKKDKDSADVEENMVAIIGRKEDIPAAKKAVLERVEQIQNTVEETTEIEPQYCRELIRSQFLQTLMDEYDGVQLHLPRTESEGNTVSIKGAKEDVAAVIDKLQKQVQDFKTRVSIKMPIDREHIPAVLGAGGKNVRAVCDEFNVAVKLPKRKGGAGGRGPRKGDSEGNGAAGAAAEEQEPESEQQQEEAGPTDSGADLAATSSEGLGLTASASAEEATEGDYILITGQPENCEKAQAALQALIPVSEDMTVPLAFHRLLIGTKGEDIRKLQDEANVRIKFPGKAEEGSETVVIKGMPAAIAKARDLIALRMEELKDVLLKQHKTEVEIDAVHHPALIGTRGATINELRKQFDVEINMPRKEAANPNLITIVGFEKDGEACKAEMLARVKEFEQQVVFALDLDARVRPRIIGQGGRGLRELQDKFNVRITFPRDSKEEVLIQGMQDAVEDCKEELLNMEEDMMQDVLDREEERKYMKETKPQKEPKQAGKKELKIKNAPWDSSAAAFPTLGNGAGAAAPAAASNNGARSWGPAWKQ